MSTTNKKGSGKSLTDQQKNTDDAINERIKKEKGKSKLDPREANNAKNRTRSSDSPGKKTGTGKQKNPGMWL